jgi:curved DNA-binding protein CbpA
MTNPFEVLGVSENADDPAIRAAYLDLVRRFPPEQAPERFAVIRQAFESLRDEDARLRWQLFEAGCTDTIDAAIEDLACRTPRHRLSLEQLVAAQQNR